MKRALLFIPLVSLCLLASAPSWGAECADVTYPDQIEVAGQTLQLNGLGIREATIFNVNVYVAALYVPTPSRNGEEIAAADAPWRLILTFVRDVGTDDVREAYNDSFPKTVGRGEMPTYRARLDTLLSYMDEVVEGDTFVFTYIPGTGLQIQVKGVDKGTIEGHDFASHFLLIWIGDHPPNRGLKRGLLGGRCG
ncbi:MAG: chalcone isomerase family protein [Bradymonadales bacterium]|nr:chalcone isomerase family protein [Bradymonadales bacterium]